MKKVYETFCKNQIQDVEIKLYPGARHEILNEIEYQAVIQDILSWLELKRHNYHNRAYNRTDCNRIVYE